MNILKRKKYVKTANKFFFFFFFVSVGGVDGCVGGKMECVGGVDGWVSELLWEKWN